MSLNRFAKQRDANEPEIVAALQAVGATVVRLDKPVDLLVGYRGANYLIEVKLPAGSRGGTAHSAPTDGQVVFFATWRGKASLVRTPEDALHAIGARTRENRSGEAIGG